jgi:hypothetical protein
VANSIKYFSPIFLCIIKLCKQKEVVSSVFYFKYVVIIKINMSCKKIFVKDKEDVEVRIINNVDIRIINLMLGEFVDVNACIKQDNNYIRNYTFHIEGEEYENWGNSDTYIEDLVLRKLGLERQ